MNDNEIWSKFDKCKNWDAKSRCIKNLINSNTKSTLDRLCKEFLSTTSRKYREEAIYIIELIEGKLQNKISLSECTYYQKFLKKYRIKNCRNFMLVDYKQVTFDNHIMEHIQDKINENYQNKIPQFKIRLKFKLGEKIYGFLGVRFGYARNFNFDLIEYGFKSDFRHYQDNKINWYPQQYLLLQKINIPDYKILKKNSLLFKFPSKVHDELRSYFLDKLELYKKYNNRELSHYEFIKPKSTLHEWNYLEEVLTGINVAIQNEQIDKAKKIASIGLQNISKSSIIDIWGNYLKNT